jgi:hypothetical protein
MRTLVRGVPKEKAATVFDNVAFIVFNYDRSIEQNRIQTGNGVRGDRYAAANAYCGLLGRLREISAREDSNLQPHRYERSAHPGRS